MLVRIDLRLNGVHKNTNILPPVQDTVIGKIYFLLVRIKLKHMEIEIRRRETIGSGSNARNESETLAKYEIMDGAPVRGENIPIRWAWMSALRTKPCGLRELLCLSENMEYQCKGWARHPLLWAGFCAPCTPSIRAKEAWASETDRALYST